MSFDRFIAIDWSGARLPGYRGVAVAMCEADGRLSLLSPPVGRYWRRMAVHDWLLGQLAHGRALLIGFDFAFALPFDKAFGFLPGSGRKILTPASLWQFIDDICAGQDDLYAGAVVEDPTLARLFWSRGKRPVGFDERLRATDQACRVAGLGVPQSVFKLIGAAQVGKGSFAGMRLLHRLQQQPNLSIWPFAPMGGRQSTCVEIYPSLFIMKARIRKKIRDKSILEDVLRSLDVRLDVAPGGHLDDHACDALVSAAALRYYAPVAELWRPVAMTAAAHRNEGWIFGLI